MTERSETTIGVIVATVFALIGIGLIAWGVALYQQRVELIAHGQRTTGVITGFERVGPNPEHELADTFLVPVVRYEFDSGEEIVFRGHVAERWWSDWKVGKEVVVIYDPDRPDDAQIDALADLWRREKGVRRSFLIGGKSSLTIQLLAYVPPRSPSQGARRASLGSPSSEPRLTGAICTFAGWLPGRRTRSLSESPFRFKPSLPLRLARDPVLARSNAHLDRCRPFPGIA